MRRKELLDAQRGAARFVLRTLREHTGRPIGEVSVYVSQEAAGRKNEPRTAYHDALREAWGGPNGLDAQRSWLLKQ